MKNDLRSRMCRVTDVWRYMLKLKNIIMLLVIYGTFLSQKVPHRQLSSSVVEGWHALWVQDLQLILSSTVRLIEAYEWSLVQSFMSSNHVRRGLPWAILPSYLPSSIWIALLPLQPHKTCPAKAIFCFTILLCKHPFSFILHRTSSFEIMSVHLIFNNCR